MGQTKSPESGSPPALGVHKLDRRFVESVEEVVALKSGKQTLEEEKAVLAKEKSALEEENAALRKEAQKSTSFTEIGGFTIHRGSLLDTEFDVEKAIGQGGFGQVFKCLHKIDKTLYAVKKVSVSKWINREGRPSLELVRSMQEVKSLARLKHETIIDYNECWFEQDGQGPLSLCIKMELCMMSLADVIYAEDGSRLVGKGTEFDCSQELE